MIDLSSTAPQKIGSFNIPATHPARQPDQKQRLEQYRAYIRKLHPEQAAPPKTVAPPKKKHSR